MSNKIAREYLTVNEKITLFPTLLKNLSFNLFFIA